MSRDDELRIFGRAVRKADLVKLLGLLAFLGLTAGIVVALWPSLHTIFEPDGVNRLIADIQARGALGVLMLLAMQLLQIIVAFIPGEVVQVAAGMLYGPLWGTLVILLGCVISSGIIYALVSRLGVPFVQDMVSKEHLEKIYAFERSGKLNVIVFILFVIPGMPKDVFTYLVPLTCMPLRTFLLLTTVGRIPGVVVSTYAAAGLAEGDIVTSLVIFGIAAAIAIIGVAFRDRIMDLFAAARRHSRDYVHEHVHGHGRDGEDRATCEAHEEESGLRPEQMRSERREGRGRTCDAGRTGEDGLKDEGA